MSDSQFRRVSEAVCADVDKVIIRLASLAKATAGDSLCESVLQSTDPMLDWFHSQDSKRIVVAFELCPNGKLGLAIESEACAHHEGLSPTDMIRLGTVIQRMATRIIEQGGAS